ncbi:hypothetical protein BEL04_08995 [Mucilaginibacter sp. PPCGB 2223]|nr:hypothetical protein BEL04_08995 [Mucilaginibacter sp. PPCGB 2223]
MIIFFLFISFFKNTFAQQPAEAIPGFVFYHFNKKPFTDKDVQKGKKAFFVFFDSDCDHCQRAIATIGQHYQEFNHAMIYLVSLDSQDKMQYFMKTYGKELINRPNVMLLQDPRNDFLIKFRPRKYPSMFLYSETGTILIYEDNPENIFRIFKQL